MSDAFECDECGELHSGRGRFEIDGKLTVTRRGDHPIEDRDTHTRFRGDYCSKTCAIHGIARVVDNLEQSANDEIGGLADE